MSVSDPARALTALLKQLRARREEPAHKDGAPAGLGKDGVVEELIFSFMLWDASTPQARTAMKKLQEAYVDANELRISFPPEIVQVLGERYPHAAERSERLRACLGDIYRREHGVSLAPLLEMSKREARAYLESLEGIPSFVAARVVLVALEGHAIPVDHRLVSLLMRSSVTDQTASPESVQSWLERQISADQAAATHAMLQAWSDEEGTTPAREHPCAGGACQSSAAAPKTTAEKTGKPAKSRRGKA